MTNMNHNRGTLGGDAYRAGSNGRTDTGVSNAYSHPNTGHRSGNDHRDNGRGKGGILMVVLLCVTILVAAHMIADGMKSANQNQVAATTIETTPQETAANETSEEDDDEPEEAAEEEQEQTEKEPVIKDKVRLTSLDPVNVVSRYTGHDDFPTVSDITDVWKNNYTSAYIMEWSYEFTYDTNGEYDAFAATLCTTSTSNSTGKLQIYDADGDEPVLLWESRLEANSKPKSIKVDLRGCEYVTFKYSRDMMDGTLGLADAAFVTYE